VYNAWTNWSIWTIATAPEVHGVQGPDLADGSKPSEQLSVGHAVDGMWVSQ
jgi:peptide/nickel transport system substrate-binding protein